MVGSTTHQFEMRMDLGNAAFDGAEERKGEIARLLRHIAEAVENGADCGLLFDVNGNNVGSFEFDPFEPEADEEECPECGALNAPGEECWQCAESSEA